MEKLQLKMRMLNVAVTEEAWEAFDLLIKFWKKMGIKDESAMAGAMLSAGTNEVMNGIVKINKRDPEILDKLKSIETGKGGINESFNVAI